MGLKQFYGEMDKKDRQIFSEIEKMIANSKMECLAAIPKNQVYDDSKIKKDNESILSKIDKLEKIKMHFEKNLFAVNLVLKRGNEQTELLNKNIDRLAKRQALMYGYLILIQKMAENILLDIKIEDKDKSLLVKIMKDNHNAMNEILLDWEKEK
jgi:hypothetical protein